jgi:urea transport system substrate-binding protein
LPRYVRPEPWPTFRSTQHWGAVLLRTESRP